MRNSRSGRHRRASDNAHSRDPGYVIARVKHPRRGLSTSRPRRNAPLGTLSETASHWFDDDCPSDRLRPEYVFESIEPENVGVSRTSPPRRFHKTSEPPTGGVSQSQTKSDRPGERRTLHSSSGNFPQPRTSNRSRVPLRRAPRSLVECTTPRHPPNQGTMSGSESSRVVLGTRRPGETRFLLQSALSPDGPTAGRK